MKNMSEKQKFIFLFGFIVLSMLCSALVSCSKRDNEDNPYAFLKEYNYNKKGADNKMSEHPRLLFSSNDIDKIRKKVKDGWLKVSYEEMEQYANKLMLESTAVSTSAAFGRRICRKVNSLALTGYIKDDRRYIDKALQILMYQIEKYDADFFYSLNSDLAVGDAAQAYAVGYDWLEPFMTDEQKTLALKEIEEFGSYLMNISTTKYLTPFNFSTNWNAVVNGGLGLCALVLGNREDWLEQATKLTEEYFKYSTDGTGYNYEGVGYYCYGSWASIPFAAALERLKGIDIVENQPKLKLMSDYFLRIMLPQRKETVMLSDSAAHLSNASGIMYLISKFKDKKGLWTWLNLMVEDGKENYGHSRNAADADGCSIPYTIIWADPTLKPIAPDEAKTPLNKVFESGRVSLRDGWDVFDSLLIYNSGYAAHSGHSQRDDNSFNFYALGEEFCIDPGYVPWLEVDHSLVVVDGVRNERVASDYKYSAKLIATREYDDAFYIKGDASDSHVYFPPKSVLRSPKEKGISSVVRQIMFVHSPEGLKQPYFVVVDDITKNNSKESVYSWLLQTTLKNRIDVIPGGNSAKITGSNYGAVLNVDFLYPEKLNIKEVNYAGTSLLGRQSVASYNPATYHKTLSAEVKSENVRFIVVLTANEKGGEKPEIIYEGEPFDARIRVNFKDGTSDLLEITKGNIEFTRN